MNYLISIVGLIVVLGLAWIASNNRKEIKIRPIIQMIIIQLILTFILLNTKFGLIIIEGIAAVFTKLLDFANEGINFVFAGHCE